MKLFITLLFSLVYFSGVAQISHKQWDIQLKKFVDDKGNVNYADFKQEEAQLDLYLHFLSSNPPKASWTKNEIKAYWINAYNAFTIKIILKHFPIKSIKDIGGSFYRVNTTWDIEFIFIDGESLDLNDIEHKKLRAQFDDPRIHVAVNCASFSCPKLRNEAYNPTRLERQLDDQARYFVNNSDKNNMSNPQNPKISKLFGWYRADFEKNGNSLIGFLNKYGSVHISENAKLDYLEYNWSLNEQKR